MEEGGNTGNDDNARPYPHVGDSTAEVGYIGVNGDIESENGDSSFPTA